MFNKLFFQQQNLNLKNIYFVSISKETRNNLLIIISNTK